MKKLYMLKAFDAHDTAVKVTVANDDKQAEEAWTFFFGDEGYVGGSVNAIEEVDGHIVRVEDKNAISLFYITTFAKLEKNKLGYYDFGSTRTVGCFPTLEAAQDIVIHNRCDLCETIYDYAMIEEMSVGLYASPIQQELYMVKNPTVMKDGKEIYNPNLNYERIDLPKELEGQSFVMG